jgi:arsenate reductase
MKKKVYYLNSCSTCKRILKEVPVDESFEQQEIKSQPITAKLVDTMAKAAGSYEAIFSRKSLQYRGRGLHEKSLTEDDYRALLLEEYTFLKRPVFMIGNKIFAGNSKKVLEELREALK